ncbi:hypothetical protein BMAFMH_I0018 [Burkholderia mallei FMH]|nr:hypothetical protein BMAFMH_I0018 [Burkholderia mallei FMH]
MEILASARWAARRGRSYAWGGRRFGERCGERRADARPNVPDTSSVCADFVSFARCAAVAARLMGATAAGRQAEESMHSRRAARWRARADGGALARARRQATTSDDT